MEGFSVSFYKSFTGYWKRKDYKRLERSVSVRKKPVTSGWHKTKFLKSRSWRVKFVPKVLYRAPKKCFIHLRDSYVDMMNGFARSRVISTGYGGVTVGGENRLFGYGLRKGSVESCDEKMIARLYKSLTSKEDELVSVGRDIKMVCNR